MCAPTPGASGPPALAGGELCGKLEGTLAGRKEGSGAHPGLARARAGGGWGAVLEGTFPEGQVAGCPASGGTVRGRRSVLGSASVIIAQSRMQWY